MTVDKSQITGYIGHVSESVIRDIDEGLAVSFALPKPFFNASTKKINLGSSTTLTDSNGVFKYYPTFNKTIDKVTFKHTKH